jgi:hypothetical protein
MWKSSFSFARIFNCVTASAVEGQLPNKDDVPLAEFWYLSALDVFRQATKDSYENVLAIRKAGVELNEQVKRAMATMSKGSSCHLDWTRRTFAHGCHGPFDLFVEFDTCLADG